MTDRPPGAATSKEWNAAAYHLLSEPQFLWGMRVLERVSIIGDEHVLDAGCGSGRLTKELAARVPRGCVVACDLSENMARSAAQTLGGAGGSRVVCADLSMLPFLAAFDLIFSTAVFHWIRDHDRLFAELRGALRHGGRLEAQCGGGPNLAVVHARGKALSSSPRFREHFQGWRDPWFFTWPEETKARLLRAGFARARCSLEHARRRFRMPPGTERSSKPSSRGHFSLDYRVGSCAASFSTRWSPTRPTMIRPSRSTTGV
jgi:trans-aconitate 2-methyltransferase